MKTWLSKRLSIGSVLVLWLLGACASNPNPSTNQSTLAGIWLENTARSNHCDNTESFDSRIKLELNLQDKQVTGSVTMTLLENNTELKGNFSGTQNDKHLTGVITFSNQRKWDANLNLTASTLEGSLTDQTEEPCASSGSDYWKTQVTFLREVTEPVSVDNKEPNNSATQATPIQLEDSFHLSLSPNDIDWFKFSLTKPAEIQFDITLLNAMGLRARILDEDQEVQDNLESDSSSLTTQANSWQIKNQLPAGDYFLLITGFDDEAFSGKHKDNGRYTLSFISSEALPDDASEPNNNSTQATPITLDFSKEYYLGIEDQDWFSFTLSNTQLLEFSLQGGPGFTATLYSQNLQELFSTNTIAILPFNQSLPSGKYYLKLTRQTSQGGYYTLGIKAKTVPDAALEPNNTFDTATPITLDYEGSSYLDGDDQDWYRFELSEMRIITFDFGPSYIGLQLLNAEQTDLGLYPGYPTITRTLPEGIYYLRLYGGHSLSVLLSVTSIPIPDQQNEPNNSLNTATPITLDYQGSSHLYVGDEDWYSFTLSQNRLVSFDFSLLSSFYVHLFDAQGNDLNLYYEQPKTIGLQAGTYYLRLYNSYDQELPIISFNITTQLPPDNDLEPNNSLNQTTPLTLPFTHEVYSSSVDEDWYSFSLNSESLMSYQFTRDVYAGDVFLYLFDSLGQNIYYQSASPGNDPEAIVSYLKAGVYYLKITSHSSLSYKLSIARQTQPDTRFEPNNSIEQAHEITVGFEQNNMLVYSSSYDSTFRDDDFFRFNLSQATQLIIQIDRESISSYLNTYIQNDSGSYATSLTLDYANDIILPPGNYSLQISAPWNESVKYRLSVKAK